MLVNVQGKRQDLKLLLFDLDGTLLTSGKKISSATLEAIREYQNQGVMVGISTSRGETMCLDYIDQLHPEVIIASAGAIVRYRGKMIYLAEFSPEETRKMIAAAREIGGGEIEITVDTIDEHFWNYHVDPEVAYKGWGSTTYTDYRDFDLPSLKTCIQFTDDHQAKALADRFPDADYARFSDITWYKYTPRSANKEAAIQKVLEAAKIETDNIMSFGDDYTDIGMLQVSGIGVAMENAIPEVKTAADVVIGTNDEDGIAAFLNTIRV